MKVTFLGTGTSQGVPVITCDCEVCRSSDPKDKRLRSSVLIENGDMSFIIDSGPDFRQQMLRENVKKLDAILFTHEHKDHIAGLDDIRAFNYVSGRPMEIYAEKRVQKILKKDYSYAFADDPYPGVPKMNLNTINSSPFLVNQTQVVPIRVMHKHLPILGFRIYDFAYITDGKTISEHEKKKLQGLKILVINALRKEEHISHFTLTEALQIIEELKPEVAYLTHISHAFGKYYRESPKLPENVFLAFDGLKIDA